MSKNITDKIEFSEEFENVTPSILKEKLEMKGQMIDKFWKIWANEYLLSLPKIVAQFEDKCTLKKGAIVLVEKGNVPRLEWPKGIVVRTFPSQDGLIPSAEIKNATNTLIRPIQNLVDLEINEDASERITEMIDQNSRNKINSATNLYAEEVQYDDPSPIVTRSGLITIKPNRLGID